MKETKFPLPLVSSCNHYKMDHKQRGKAYIFNYYKFNDLLVTREGVELDVERLKFILSKCYGFEVKICTDYTHGKIYETLWNAANEDYSDCDCILIIIMSHGEEGRVYAKDTLYNVEDLWMPFMFCPTLAGKPKILFIQSFWGTRTGIRLSEVPNPISRFTVPSAPDVLIMYSTFEGYYSVRSMKIVGSWFIQRLCDELECMGHHHTDLVQILTHVNIVKENSPRLICHDKENHGQVGVIVSSLTGPIYLSRKDLVNVKVTPLLRKNNKLRR